MMEVGHVQIPVDRHPPANEGFVEPDMRQLEFRRARLVLLMIDLEASPIQQLGRSCWAALLIEIELPSGSQDRYDEERHMTFVTHADTGQQMATTRLR